MLAMIVDIVVMVLLLMTIIFCWRLNNKIMELKSGRKDLLELVKTLDATIMKTNNNIAELKMMSKNSTMELATLVNKAKTNINDLSFINDTAVKLADRLERAIADSRYSIEKLQVSTHAPISHQKIPPISENQTVNSNLKALKSGFNRAKEELRAALRFVK